MAIVVKQTYIDIELFNKFNKSNYCDSQKTSKERDNVCTRWEKFYYKNDVSIHEVIKSLYKFKCFLRDLKFNLKY